MAWELGPQSSGHTITRDSAAPTTMNPQQTEGIEGSKEQKIPFITIVPRGLNRASVGRVLV